MKKFNIKLLDKYIIKEITFPFFSSVIIITIILLGNYLFQLTDLIIVKEVPIALVLRLLLYNLPDIIVRTFPIAILFSTMTGIGRLNRENEITAFRMGGISLYRLIIPVLILGIIVSGLTFVFNEEIVPWSNHKAQNIIRNTILKESMPNTREEVFFKGPKDRLFYVKEYNEEQDLLKDIVIYNINQNNREESFPEVITAKSGRTEENLWVLQNGIIHEYNDQGNIILESQFEEMEFQITEEMREVYGNQKTTNEMSREELAKNIRLFRKSGINVDSLLVDYHLKLAQPLVAFIFVLIAVPLSLTNKESKTINITLTIIIIFFYYLMQSVSRSLGRNQILPPLIAAWLPNIIFLLLGMLILFMQESWEKLLHKVIPGMIIFFLIFSFVPQGVIQAQDEIHISSDSVNYNEQLNMIEIKGNVSGNYENIYMRSDLIEIKVGEGEGKLFKTPENIKLSSGDISGCDYEIPHYFFDAQKIVITPNEHLKAYHVVFKELEGKLPLFYWPYLYISLKDEEQNFFPRVGYNSKRGWFLKTTYKYYIDRFGLPGDFYLDYYTLTGFAGGIKQYLIHEPNHKSYLYYYRQDNNINLPNLFNWEGEFFHQYEGKNWNEEFSYYFQEFENKEVTNIELLFDNKYERRNINIDTYYDNTNYYDSIERDITSYGADFSFRNRYFDSLSLNLGYEIDYDYEPEDGLEFYRQREVGIVNRWGNNWEVGLDYEHEEQNKPDSESRTRWSGESYITKDYRDYNFKLLWERYDPNFSAEDEVAFYRAPEFTAKYEPRGNFDYLFQIGHYYEDDYDIKGNRAKAQIEYNKRFYLGRSNRLNINQILHTNYYDISSQYDYDHNFQTVSESNLKLTTRLGEYITLNNSYEYIKNFGSSPFNFDKSKLSSITKNQLTFDVNDRVNIDLNSGYDFEKEEYLLLELLADFKIIEGWNIELGTDYDLNQQRFNENLFLTSKFKNNRANHSLGLEYNLNDDKLVQLDSSFSYEIKGDWGWYLENNLSFNFEEQDKIKEANIQIKKKFHCRELIFSYDYLKEEYTVQYSINLFPSQGIEMTKSKDALIFDANVKEMIEQENE